MDLDYLSIEPLETNQYFVSFICDNFDLSFACSSKYSINDILSFIELEWKEYLDNEISK